MLKVSSRSLDSRERGIISQLALLTLKYIVCRRASLLVCWMEGNGSIHLGERHIQEKITYTRTILCYCHHVL